MKEKERERVRETEVEKSFNKVYNQTHTINNNSVVKKKIL